MNRNFAWLPATLLGTLLVQGCEHCCHQRYPAQLPPTVVSPAPVPAAPFAPTPQGLPQTPAAPVPPAAIRGYEPPLATPIEPAWRPSADGGVRFAGPDDAFSSPPGAARLQEPQFTPPPPANLLEASAPTPLLPAGIPQFAIAKHQVATGLKPMLDGIDWLKQNGYRTVLHLRPPGEDDAAQRRLFEMRGLKYLSLEISPQTLSRAVVDEFNRIVDDRSNQPLFIYDKEGALSGGLWYLHFRFVERLSDEEARIRAGRLGLRETQNGLQSEMWLAIQKFQSEPAR
jgi:protein tyrosine phosphatase (PTP) superfamily phosphohydrolase (DUF442 family)